MLQLNSLATLALIALSSAASASSSSPQYTVHHRFLPHPNPSTSTPPFIPLGRLSLNEDGSVDRVPLDAGSSVMGGSEDDGKGWYQVALSTEGPETLVGDEQDGWMIASTRSCYLASSRPKLSITSDLSTTSSPTLEPLYISVSPSVSGGRGCPPGSNETSVSLPKSLDEIVWEFKWENNVVRGPSLSAAPAVDPTTGTVKAPEPEKSFFQKYWMYVIGVSLFLITQLGPDEPKAGGGGGAGGAGAKR
ncbi:hypothetical protein IAT40_006553 [Kwoniella sp. CBS 6097]